MGLGSLRRRGASPAGLLVDVIAAQHLIWVIVAMAALGAVVSLGLQPLDHPRPPSVAQRGATMLLREGGFLAIIAALALIQGSHAAYYTFASITLAAIRPRRADDCRVWALA